MFAGLAEPAGGPGPPVSPPRCRGLLPGLAAAGRSPRPGSRPTSARAPQGPPGGPLPPGEMHPCEGPRIGHVGRGWCDSRKRRHAPGQRVVAKNRTACRRMNWKRSRTLLIKQRLQNHIETLLINQDAKRTIPSEGWCARPGATRQRVRGSRVGEDDEAVGRRHAPRVGRPTPRLRHLAGKGEAGVLQARAGPPVGRSANQAQRRSHLGPDAHLLPEAPSRFHQAGPGEVGGADGQFLEISQQGRGLRRHRAAGQPGRWPARRLPTWPRPAPTA